MERKWIDEAGGSSWPRPTERSLEPLPAPVPSPTLVTRGLAEAQGRLEDRFAKFREVVERERAEAEARLEERRRQLEEVDQVEARTRALSAEGADPNGNVRISISGGEAPSTVTISEELARTGDADAIARAVSEALRAAQERLRRSILAEWAEAGVDAPPDSPLAEASRTAKERLAELNATVAAEDAVGPDHLRVEARHALGSGSEGPDHELDKSLGAGLSTKRRRAPRLV